MKITSRFFIFYLLVIGVIIVLSTSCNKDDHDAIDDSSGFVSRTFTDQRDGTTYRFVYIGTQVWMAENLRYLPSVVGPGIACVTSPYYYVYGYDGTDVTMAKSMETYKSYGVLYNWPAATAGEASSDANPSGMQGVCPTGWHLPSDEEWAYLIENLGGENKAGGKLKETDTLHWKSPNNEATNLTGFTGRPGGMRYHNSTFVYLGVSGSWWTSTEVMMPSGNLNSVWSRHLYYIGAYAANKYFDKHLGFSVRCVRDE